MRYPHTQHDRSLPALTSLSARTTDINPLLPPSELEKPWITLPCVGHCHTTFDATGATTFALTGVLFVVST